MPDLATTKRPTTMSFYINFKLPEGQDSFLFLGLQKPTHPIFAHYASRTVIVFALKSIKLQASQNNSIQLTNMAMKAHSVCPKQRVSKKRVGKKLSQISVLYLGELSPEKPVIAKPCLQNLNPNVSTLITYLLLSIEIVNRH